MAGLSAKGAYLLCLFLFVFLDQIGITSSNGHFYEHLKQPFGFSPIPPEFIANIPFMLLGIVLIPVMIYWRRFIKAVGRYFLLKLYCINEGTYKHELFKTLIPMQKFEENFWIAFHYFSVTVIEICVLTTLPIWPPMLRESSIQSISPPLHVLVEEQRNHFGVKLIYLIQFTYYFMELLMLIVDTNFAAKKRKDAIVYLFHHSYTVFLIGVSWITLNHRIGLIVLFFHDLPDIFLPTAKCFSYQDQFVKKLYSEGTYKRAKAVGLIPFVGFVLTLLLFRIILYPCAIHFLIYGADFAMKTFSADSDGGIGYRTQGNAYQVILIFFLMLLYPLHIYWLSLILKMIPRVLSEQYDDVRSSEGDIEEVKDGKA